MRGNHAWSLEKGGARPTPMRGRAVRRARLQPPLASNAAATPAGATPTSPSTTTPAWRTSSCADPKAHPTAWPSPPHVIHAHHDSDTPIQRILTDNSSCYRNHAFRHPPAPPRHPPHPHSPPHTTHKRQSRGLSSASRNANRPTPTPTHQHPPRQIPPRLDTLLHHAPTTRRQSTTTHPSAASHTLRGPTPRPRGIHGSAGPAPADEPVGGRPRRPPTRRTGRAGEPCPRHLPSVRGAPSTA
jgi:hypothetical protein